MTQAAQAWQLLSSAEQNAWTSYANGHPVLNRLGSSIKLTGSQYFIKCAAALLNAGAAIPTVPPTSTTIQPPLVLNFAMNDAPTMALTLTPGTAGDYICFAVAKWTSNGVNFMKTFSQVDVEASTVASEDIMDAWVAFAGLPVVGNKAWVRLTPVNSGGLTGTPLILQTSVLPASDIVTPAVTSPIASQASVAWTGTPASAVVQFQSGPAAIGPWGPVQSQGPGTTPQVIMGQTSGHYLRARIQDPALGLSGPWSAAHVIT